MQRNKNTNDLSEFKDLAGDSEKLTSSLTDVMDKFNLKKNFSIFDWIKCKGLAVSSALSILIILPFYSVASVYALFSCGLKNLDIQGKKDAYYDIKNSEFINWRKLLMLHAKRFIYLINNNIDLKSTGITALIFDDTLLEKTGKKFEKISRVNDHVSGLYVLGFKLLVCGFWDGASFIPLDFTIHREKGKKHIEVVTRYMRSQKVRNQMEKMLDEQIKDLNEKTIKLEQVIQIYVNNKTPANVARYEKVLEKKEKTEAKLNECRIALSKATKEQEEARKQLKRYYAKDSLYGLTAKEREAQYKKAVSTKSEGFKRRKEADKDKITCMLEMLCRVVKCGIIPKFVLIDSWFFCQEVLEKIDSLKKGIIKLISMVKINNQLFTLCKTDKTMGVKMIIKTHERNAKKCVKLKAEYIKVPCFYKGIRVNLFFVRMGKCKTWHLLLTTDLELDFIKLMEVYQIRWSIEIFFKECKQ